MAPKAKKEGARYVLNYFVKISDIPKTFVLISTGRLSEAVMFASVTV